MGAHLLNPPVDLLCPQEATVWLIPAHLLYERRANMALVFVCPGIPGDFGAPPPVGIIQAMRTLEQLSGRLPLASAHCGWGIPV